MADAQIMWSRTQVGWSGPGHWLQLHHNLQERELFELEPALERELPRRSRGVRLASSSPMVIDEDDRGGRGVTRFGTLLFEGDNLLDELEADHFHRLLDDLVAQAVDKVKADIAAEQPKIVTLLEHLRRP